MAAKLKLMKFMDEARALAEVTNRRPAPRPPMLYLLQLRSQMHQLTPPKRRLIISVDLNGGAETSLPVKINFPPPAEATCADTTPL
jgi:hypothetical protein